MATSSFLSEVKIQNDQDAEKLAGALEKAEKNANGSADVVAPYSDASREEIRNMFLGAQ